MMSAAPEQVTSTPAAGQIKLPSVAKSAAAAVKMQSFVLRGGLVDACFIRRSDTLLVTFDNLGSVGEYVPPQPWLTGMSARLGHSILGIMASQKDWYRNADTPKLICDLRDAGLFGGFRRILFVGTSMGGYAALAFSSLVPEAAVLAFSPQTSLSRQVAPFEKRYRYGLRRWDWTSPDFLDAAACVAPKTEVFLAYDPFVPEDRAHALRVKGKRISHIHLPHMGHRAIRAVKDLGALPLLIGSVAEGRFDALELARALRSRRADLSWKRALFAAADRRGHGKLALAAARRLVQLDPEDGFSQRLVARLGAKPDLPADPEPDSIIQIRKGKPRGPFNGSIQHLSGALVLPEREGDAKLASGVLTADGTYAELSRAWIRARKSTPAPTLQPDESITDLPGRHLFAGHFRGHFGHFLVESTARLWALDHIGAKLDSILYLPFRGDLPATLKAIAGLKPMFDLLEIDTPVRSHAGVLRAEKLYLPELGFGWQVRYSGSPAYRQFMCMRLSAAAPASGGDKLYISRAQLAANRGGILGETLIEENLSRAGFEIFHPEKHPIEVQIARYKAAKTIVALDGSALHLAAYVVPAGAKVAIILRRSSANVADYIRQYQGFKGITPDVIDVIRRDWISGDSTRADFKSVGELDFMALFARLKDLGHLPAKFQAYVPSLSELADMLAEQGQRRGDDFRPLAKGERHPDEAIA